MQSVVYFDSISSHLKCISDVNRDKTPAVWIWFACIFICGWLPSIFLFYFFQRWFIIKGLHNFLYFEHINFITCAKNITYVIFSIYAWNVHKVIFQIYEGSWKGKENVVGYLTYIQASRLQPFPSSKHIWFFLEQFS